MAQQANAWPSTQIGVGVVSLNVVDAAVEVAQEHDVSLMLIASRRQIDAEEFGGGYVEGLTPHTLTERVRSRDHRNRVVVCRDHGGPWQGANNSAETSPELAMEEARMSFFADLDAGFDLLHIDTCVCPSPTDPDVPKQRLLELYEDCWEQAVAGDHAIAFEVGDEEQSSVTEGLEQPRKLLEALAERRESQGTPAPLFVVVQTGTKVMERRNVGSLSAPYRIDEQMPSRDPPPTADGDDQRLRHAPTPAQHRLPPRRDPAVASAARHPRGQHRARVRRRGDARAAVGHGGTRRQRSG